VVLHRLHDRAVGDPELREVALDRVVGAVGVGGGGELRGGLGMGRLVGLGPLLQDERVAAVGVEERPVEVEDEHGNLLPGERLLHRGHDGGERGVRRGATAAGAAGPEASRDGSSEGAASWAR
jgi:hypothetical protein